jgi:aminoglycoside phosphotransferase (APT) family kinase protein
MPDSTTKQTLTLETAAKLLAEFSDKPLVSMRELGDGFYNSAYLLECAGDQRIVLKIAPPPATRVLRQEVGLMQIEVDTMRYVAANTSLPVPHILAHRTDSPHIASPYMAMAYIEGTPLDRLLGTLPDADRWRVFHSLGRHTAELHKHHTAQFGAPTHRHVTWSAAFGEMFRDVLLDAEDVGADLGVSPQTLPDTVESCAGALDEVRVPTLLHRDLWYGNIFVDPATLEIVGITDWERSISGDPLMEFVCALLEGLFAPEGNSAFNAGYGRSGALSDSERTRVALYSIYLALLLIVEGYYRGYRKPEQEQQMHRALMTLEQGLLERSAR